MLEEEGLVKVTSPFIQEGKLRPERIVSQPRSPGKTELGLDPWSVDLGPCFLGLHSEHLLLLNAGMSLGSGTLQLPHTSHPAHSRSSSHKTHAGMAMNRQPRGHPIITPLFKPTHSPRGWGPTKPAGPQPQPQPCCLLLQASFPEFTSVFFPCASHTLPSCPECFPPKSISPSSSPPPSHLPEAASRPHLQRGPPPLTPQPSGLASQWLVMLGITFCVRSRPSQVTEAVGSGVEAPGLPQDPTLHAVSTFCLAELSALMCKTLTCTPLCTSRLL